MTRILVEGDYHCGNLLGLTPPDCWSPKLEAMQRVMWDFREAELKAIGPVDVHVMNGDLVDGPGRKDSMGHLTTDLDEQALMAIECAERVKAKHRVVTYGSPYHVNLNNNIERAIAQHFGIEIHDTARFKVAGKKFNFRHVIGRSDVPGGPGAQTEKEITNDLLRSTFMGHEPADVYGRQHVHYFYMVNNGSQVAFSGPAWELDIDAPGNIYPRTLRTLRYRIGFTVIDVDTTGEVFVRPRMLKVNDHFPKEYQEWPDLNPSLQLAK